MKGRIWQRLKQFFNKEEELPLTERTFPVGDYEVSWAREFEQQVIRELIENPRHERKLREEEFAFQDRLNREKLRKLLQEREKEYNESFQS